MLQSVTSSDTHRKSLKNMLIHICEKNNSQSREDWNEIDRSNRHLC